MPEARNLERKIGIRRKGRPQYFRKAIQLDPKCGDAFMHLGLIALRRYQNVGPMLREKFNWRSHKDKSTNRKLGLICCTEKCARCTNNCATLRVSSIPEGL